MEGYAAAAACGFGGVAAYLGATLVVEAAQGVRLARCSGASLRARVVSWLELIGHWFVLARLGNVPAVVKFSERLEAAVRHRGWALSRRGCVACVAVALAVLGVLGLVVSQSLLGLAVGFLAALSALVALVNGHESASRNAAAAQMPEVLRSLAAALGAGKSLPQAIEHVGRNLGDPMGSEFLKTSFEIRGGRSIDEAVGALCARVDAPGVALLGTALQISQRTGSSVSDLFARTARMVGETVSLQRELQVKTSQVRLSAKVVAAMPLVLTCVLVLFSVDYRTGLSLPAGRACLCVAAVLDIVALAAVQGIMRRSLA